MTVESRLAELGRPNAADGNLVAVLYGPGDLRVEARPVPVPGPGQVLIRVEAVGICGSDVHYYEHGRIGRYRVDAPLVLGHESAGWIVDAGRGVDRRRVGELVALEPGVPCRRCRLCLSGRYNLCREVAFFATPPVDGSLARFVVLDARFAHTAPAGMDAETAAMAEPVSVGLHACRTGRVGLGDRVLVTGAGPIGLLAAQVARASGAQAVTVADPSGIRLRTARMLGLETTAPGGDSGKEGDESGPDDAESAEEYDVLLECSGAPPALEAGLRSLAPGGRAVLVGMGADRVEVDLPRIQEREITLIGIFRYANTYPEALALLDSERVLVAPVITHRYPLSAAQEALTLGHRDGGALKAVVFP